MKKTQEELQKILRLHSLWLKGHKDGIRANLAGAELREANLRNADLRYANLAGAYLEGAILSGADLSYAYLADANLEGADLADVNLSHAYLRDVVLSYAYLAGANLRYANLAGANLADAIFDLEIPLVEDLDARIASAVGAHGEHLDMGVWHHSCGTIHCRAGWAIALAGEAGSELEEKVGPCAAGALIYHRSVGYVPDFYADQDIALRDILSRANMS
jgi:hypothetical protein